MKLLPTQTDEAALLRFGREVVSLIERRDFQSLADRFGYALAGEKSPVIAIEEEFQGCIAKFRASSEQRPPALPSMVVKYFEPNRANLFAVVECVFGTPEGCPILAELIVSLAGEDKYVTLEEISLARA
jgi:hypothetical protein